MAVCSIDIWLNLLGYFANKAFGKIRGLLFTGVFGGLVSSTSTTIALASRARLEKSKNLKKALGGAALIATGVSFLPLMALSLSASYEFFKASLPVNITMLLTCLWISIWALTRDSGREKVNMRLKPFSVAPAMKFVLLFMIIRILLQIVEIYFGDTAFIIATALSGVVGMDMATITIGEMVGAGNIALSLGLMTYVVTNGVNFIAKVVYARMQEKGIFLTILIRSLILTLSLGALVFVLDVWVV